jgi:regulator of sigma E protease
MLIVSHEFGHFLAATLNKVKVLEFSVGMGPLIASKQTRLTKWSLRALPVGGFCSMQGEDEEDPEPKPGSINAIHPLRRVFVMIAGAIMNFVVAYVIFFVIFAVQGTDLTTTLDTVLPGSPAEAAGIVPGDTLVSIGGAEISEWAEVSEAVALSSGRELGVVVMSADGTSKTVALTPYADDSGAYKIDVTSKTKFVLSHAVANSAIVIGEYIVAITKIFAGIFTGQYRFGEVLSGPIGVTAEIGRQISAGFMPLLYIAAAISVSIGFFNLLPLPALDGGRVVFAIVEWIKGSPVNRKWEGRMHYVGFMLLMALAVLIAYNDIARLIAP